MNFERMNFERIQLAVFQTKDEHEDKWSQVVVRRDKGGCNG